MPRSPRSLYNTFEPIIHDNTGEIDDDDDDDDDDDGDDDDDDDDDDEDEDEDEDGDDDAPTWQELTTCNEQLGRGNVPCPAWVIWWKLSLYW